LAAAGCVGDTGVGAGPVGSAVGCGGSWPVRRAIGRSGVAGIAAQPAGGTRRAGYGRWTTVGQSRFGGGGGGNGAGRAGCCAWPPRGEADGRAGGDGAAARLCCRGACRRRETTRRGAPTAAGQGRQSGSCACVAANADSRLQRGASAAVVMTPAATAQVQLGPLVGERGSAGQASGESGALEGGEWGGV